MLAVDQREALRRMMAEQRTDAVTDQDLRDFKLKAAELLSPHASAILIDKQFAFDAAVRAGVVAKDCALIASADRFHEVHGELVGEVDLDPAVDPATVAGQGAKALKLLVLYRPDTPAGPRIALVESFVRKCRDAGLVSIIEPVSRPPISGTSWDWNGGVLEAARELGALGADLYKAEMPHHGRGAASEMSRDCSSLTEAIASPWVILSSGVAENDFESAIATACEAGASGFLAGRAVWASCLASGSPDDVAACLAGPAVDRLRRYAAVADAAVG